MSKNHSPEEILQSILRNVQVGGNLTTGDITQILNLLVIIQQPDVFKPKEIPQNIPRGSIVKFVGRAETLVSLHERLQHSSQVVIAAIEGMGGVGKTELATQYALIHLLLNTYPGGICWLRARDEDIGLQILQFAIAKLGLKPPEDWDLPKQVDFCWSRWHDGNVLVVLDDVNDYPKVEQYLPPQSPRFKLLITSRLQLDFSQSFTLDVLSESAALELLQEWVGAEKVARELEDAKEICQRLGCLPLALNLVGRYVKKRKISLAEMLRRLEEKKLTHESLARDEKDCTWTLNVKRGVAAAFELSWEELNDDAKELGVLLSLFALAPIPWGLVESVEMGKDAEQLEDSRVELESLHLLQGEDSYQLHQLIREFFQLKQAEFNQVEELKRSLCRVMVAVAKEIPYTLTLKQISDVTPAIPHIAEVANNLIQYVSDDDLTLPFIGNARFYQGQGLYNQALPWYNQCLEVTKKRLGEEHPFVAESLNNLALLYESQGRYSEAEPLYIQDLVLTRKLLGEEHLGVATSLNNLAVLYNSQGRYSEAEPLYIQALALTRKLLGEEHLDVAQSLNNLAVLYDYQSRYSEAEPLHIQALALRRKLLGEEHPHVASSLNNLAGLYFPQGRYSEAELLYTQALALRLKLLGEEHPDVAQSLNNLGYLYSFQGRYSEAEPLYIQALALRRKLLGEEHPFFAISLNNLAKLFHLQGSYTEAEPLYLQALKIFEQQLPMNHPWTVKCREYLANLRDRLPPNPE
ncbi:MAG: tetratricopeptide repeat protein [Nostoc sp.]|uniref:tetratricopeptide repeat protein n=1 Tax=unclassified Nostoc TaxID=2593658 RepID=UPI001D9B0287|nr:tetratricopeptide repeat protein [Nostoc sp. JL34]MBN3884014.1 tetratricopeptide repeat protein [Nostoc sp. JL34]